jgi:hypothetical protein
MYYIVIMANIEYKISGKKNIIRIFIIFAAKEIYY